MNWITIKELVNDSLDVFWESELHKTCDYLNECPSRVLIQTSDGADDFTPFDKFYSYIAYSCNGDPDYPLGYYIYEGMHIKIWCESGLQVIAFRQCDLKLMKKLEQEEFKHKVKA